MHLRDRGYHCDYHYLYRCDDVMLVIRICLDYHESPTNHCDGLFHVQLNDDADLVTVTMNGDDGHDCNDCVIVVNSIFFVALHSQTH